MLSSPLVIYFCDGPSLHCLEGNSLECSIRLLRATHHALFFDLHPSMPDGVHGPLLLLLEIVKKGQLKAKKRTLLISSGTHKNKKQMIKEAM